ncbi:MAG: hypothetical protein GXP27_02265 [Planctomycetes bacterium]|nr:hypothetical protein [Planctomycetota bacterium]
MVRFLHTADWQIGMKAAHVGEKAERVRDERLNAARRVVQVGREHSAEFIVVAGDTFKTTASIGCSFKRSPTFWPSLTGRFTSFPGTMIRSCLARCGIIPPGKGTPTCMC